MHRTTVLVVALILAGCAGTSEPGPKPLAPEPPREAPLAARASPPRCTDFPLSFGKSRGVVTQEVLDRASEAAQKPLSQAICACAPGPGTMRLVVKITPDRGYIEAKTADGVGAVDACLEERLRETSFPPFHFGSDCIDCGPKRYGVFPGSPAADAAPRDGSGSIRPPLSVIIP